MGIALKTFLETEIAIQTREIKSLERRIAKGETWLAPRVAVNQRNVEGYKRELEEGL